MPNQMRKTRLVNNSIHRYIAQVLTDAGYGSVKMYDAYPNVEKDDFLSNLPSVSVSFGRIDGEDYELGNLEQRKSRICMLDIFTGATLDGQLVDIGDIIYDSLTIDATQTDLMDDNLSTPISIGVIEFRNAVANIIGVVPRVYCQLTISFDCITYE